MHFACNQVPRFDNALIKWTKSGVDPFGAIHSTPSGSFFNSGNYEVVVTFPDYSNLPPNVCFRYLLLAIRSCFDETPPISVSWPPHPCVMVIGCGRCASPRDGAHCYRRFRTGVVYESFPRAPPLLPSHNYFVCSLQYGLVTSLHRRSRAPGLCPRGSRSPRLVPAGQGEHGPRSADLREIHLRELPEASRQIRIGSTGCARELLQNTGLSPLSVCANQAQEAY